MRTAATAPYMAALRVSIGSFLHLVVYRASVFCAVRGRGSSLRWSKFRAVLRRLARSLAIRRRNAREHCAGSKDVPALGRVTVQFRTETWMRDWIR